MSWCAGIKTKIGNHSFWATEITVFRKLGRSLENAALTANHASTRLTQLYDRCSDNVTLDEVERIIFSPRCGTDKTHSKPVFFSLTLTPGRVWTDRARRECLAAPRSFVAAVAGL
jgi:hypothetical protein